MPASGANHGIALHISHGDMAAGGNGAEVGGDVLHGDVAALRFQPRRAAHTCRREISASSHQGNPAVNALRFNVAGLGVDIELKIPRDAQLEGNPQVPAEFLRGQARTDENTIRHHAGGNEKPRKIHFRVGLARVGLDAYAIAHLARILRADANVADIRHQAQPLAIAHREGTGPFFRDAGILNRRLCRAALGESCRRKQAQRGKERE
ncbi:MAG: hypothetical protein HY012_02460 [Acidobacteria bacterium]|nr:hypothetical protein [Acidobacteriota bacterium]